MFSSAQEIHTHSFSITFILVRVTVDWEPILGTVDRRPGWDSSPLQGIMGTHLHSHSHHSCKFFFRVANPPTGMYVLWEEVGGNPCGHGCERVKLQDQVITRDPGAVKRQHFSLCHTKSKQFHPFEWKNSLPALMTHTSCTSLS